MHEPYTTFSEIFALWDGPTALARDMGVKTTTADQWRRRGYVHPRYWPRLIEQAALQHEVAITPRQLMLASAARSEEGASRQNAEAA